MGRRKSRLPKVVALAIVGLGIWGVTATNRGCDRTQARKTIVLNPTTRTSAPSSRALVAAVTPTTAEAASRPVAAGATRPAEKPSSQMLINNILVTFPEAKLIVRKEGDKLRTFLVSNDPPEVLSPAYQGNRYYFEMALDAVDDLKDLPQAEFRYKAPSAEPPEQDTPNGIFLDGDRQHLEPYDIRVTFDKEGDHLVADIRGQFIYFPKGGVSGQWVPVVARLAAKPETK